MTDAAKRCPPLPADKRTKPYRPAGGDPGHDGAPPEEVTVRGIPDPETRARAVAKRNVNHRVIFRLHHRGNLNDAGEQGQAAGDMRLVAAERLIDDDYLAGLASIPSALAALAAGGSGRAGSAAEISQMKIDASRRLEGALLSVGTLGRFVVEQVVLKNCTLAEVAKLLRVKDAAVLPALKVALDVLADRYGLQAKARAKIRGGEAGPIHPFNRSDGG